LRILLVHNPTAGAGRPSRAEITAALERAGHRVRYVSTHEERWKEAVAGTHDLILAAGGDGTVRRAAIAIAELAGARPPLAILPLGTANNVARTLGIESRLADLADGLATGRERRLGIGITRSPRGTERFVESVGLGAIAALVRGAPAQRPPPGQRPHPDAELEIGLARLGRHLSTADRRPVRITADGIDLSGEYYLVEVLNVASIGPCVQLAPEATGAGRHLSLVLAGDREKEALEVHLGSKDGCDDRAAPIGSRQIVRVQIWWPSSDGHLDDKPWPKESSSADDGLVVVEIDSTIPLVVPGERAGSA